MCPSLGNRLLNNGRNLPPNDRTNVAHQPRRLAQFARPQSLGDNHKTVVDPVVQFFRPQRTQEEVPNTFLKEGVQLLQRGSVTVLNAHHQAAPVRNFQPVAVFKLGILR